jgi:hypothetical protein
MALHPRRPRLQLTTGVIGLKNKSVKSYTYIELTVASSMPFYSVLFFEGTSYLMQTALMKKHHVFNEISGMVILVALKILTYLLTYLLTELSPS